jgi:Uma2 family endonuclease
MPGATERWTADRVRALPDDGNRYELIDGELVVTPAPRGSHQVVVNELGRLIYGALEGTPFHVLHSPADLSLGDDEVLQPDLFVYRTAGGGRLRDWSDIAELVLVIEVLSPSTARYDRGLKRRRYQRAGVPEYWIVDVDAALVERWRPGDDRPEIAAGLLVWGPEPTTGDGQRLQLDVGAFFAGLWEEP